MKLPVYRKGQIIAYATIDAEDARLAAHRWHLMGKGYVARMVTVAPYKQRMVYLHRAVLGLEHGDGRQADHENRNKLDCRRSNLRVATPQVNAENKGSCGGTSRYRGVTRRPSGRWKAQAQHKGRHYSAGCFDSEEKAAQAASELRARLMPGAVELIS